eukprot:CAMPEP_0113937328 /NCGR_PEP_ID=MMETSP1339-20121228/3973_1 /TAXON_ID=94617 /ORGANISM="Fibrocapsa japonica" /LENGTH=219 /DNA_ID=CAMNT_0000940049 /DNA_START=183 /DNA_END=839 /DNA_ORIENTATION=+ /assembly_acc=CAM_ASM_000762
MAAGTATVKAITSGDTLILMGRAAGGPPPEMQLTLGCLQAPRLARAPGAVDEPYAWQSREFLRKMCIGKVVSFKVEYRVAAINRDFGTVMLDGQSVAQAVVRDGWARVKPASEARENEKTQEYEELLVLEAAAMADKKGVFSELCEGSVRPLKWTDIDAQSILNEYKGSPVKAVIEHVRDGAALRCLLLPNWTFVNVNLSGVQCPRVNTAPRVIAPPAP